jgi:hypothetical protein
LTQVPTASTFIQQLGPNGVGAELSSLFTAAAAGTTDGTIPQSQLTLLYTAVEGAMSASYQLAAVDIYLDASGQTNGSSIDLNAIGTNVDAAFATFATAVRQAELPLLVTTPTSPTLAPTGFSVTASTTGTATGNFMVNLSSASTSPVTVQYATADGTAIAGTDYTAASGTLTFAPGTTTETVPVTILASAATSGSKTLTLNLSNPTNATIAATSAVGTIDFGTTP